LLYGLLVLEHGRRRILWVGATAHPTAEWIARQVGEACGWDSVPTYLIRDRDRVYGEAFTRRVRAMGIRDRPTAPRSPWQNGYVERLIGSIRRDCLDHVSVRRAASASCAALICAVSQWSSNASVAGQGLTANEIRPDRREHSPAADPRRIAPPLCPDLISDKDSEADIRLVTFAPGAVVGELALLDRGLRSATVTVDEDLTGFALSAAAFDELCQKQPDIAIKLLAALAHE
jgi:hypothetical protein